MTWNASVPFDGSAERSDSPSDMRRARVEISEARGFPRERAVMRHDPSRILKIGDRYYVWYTRYVDTDSEAWDEIWHLPNHTEIWLAVSDDGRHWTEVGSVLPPSPAIAWHLSGKHAPHVLVVDGTYYLYFTAHIGSDYLNKRIGLAVSESPEGPFQHWGTGPLLPADTGSCVFDVVGQDDSSVLEGDDGFWWYFKGYGYDHATQRAINNRLCVARADAPEGPYRRWHGNPIAISHTACLWRHREGVAMLSDAPQPDTGAQYVLYSRDGIRFERAAEISASTRDTRLRSALALCPKVWGVSIADPGVYLPTLSGEPDSGLSVRWGLSQLPDRDRADATGKPPNFCPFLVRFDVLDDMFTAP